MDSIEVDCDNCFMKLLGAVAALALLVFAACSADAEKSPPVPNIINGGSDISDLEGVAEPSTKLPIATNGFVEDLPESEGTEIEIQRPRSPALSPASTERGNQLPSAVLPALERETDPEVYFGVVDVDGSCLRVRESAGFDGRVLDCVGNDVLLQDLHRWVEVEPDGTIWRMVRTPAGLEGWAASEFLLEGGSSESLVSAPPPVPTSTASPVQIVTNPPIAGTPTLENSPEVVTSLTGLLVPVAGACLPELEILLPNAPREYRAGIHEGIDLYDGVACVPVERGTEVLAVAEGTVIRADRDFVEMTLGELDELLARSEENGFTTEEDLDRFRGRQVWIDHGDGFISRYAHLVEVAPDLEVGDEVIAGQVIGGVGNSGTVEGVSDADAPVHLHFEIRIGDSYLGEGLSHAEVLSLLRKVFTLGRH